MSNLAIHIENLGKRYYIGAAPVRYQTFRSAVTNAFTAPVRKVSKLLKGHATGAAGLDQALWALQDISIDIKHGEVVGIIGRNGAGKSTLLKILSKITRPTTGYADIYGRIGALLEVGTGFHPELTGRENIFLNGAILGMRKIEINNKFDEIVDFSGVEKFIDTPVKHYSSGMHTRLAFAVAAHLEPEILVIDEVLAVGDAAFQRKCLAKMQDVSHSGRAVLFVSHNMPTISRLCSRAILLEEGRMVADGPVHEVVTKYLQSDLGTSAHRIWQTHENAPGDDYVKLRSVRVINEHKETTSTVDMRQKVGIEFSFDILRENQVLVPAISLFNEQATHVLNALDTDPFWQSAKPSGTYQSTVWVPPNLLNEGALTANVLVMDVQRFAGKPAKHVFETEVVAFQVVDVEPGISAKGDLSQPWPSSIYPLLEWENDKEPQNTKATQVETK